MSSSSRLFFRSDDCCPCDDSSRGGSVEERVQVSLPSGRRDRSPSSDRGPNIVTISRIFATLCDCLSGVKTNSCCSHVIALVKSIMAPALFRPSKVFESRITDIYR